jgi:hypothetical protein
MLAEPQGRDSGKEIDSVDIDVLHNIPEDIGPRALGDRVIYYFLHIFGNFNNLLARLC